MHVILRPLLRYADFSGRASRAEYWLFGLVQMVVYGLLILFGVLSLAGVRDDPAAAIGGVVLFIGLAFLLAIGLLIPNLALLARRMHDINISAWWMGLMVPGYLAQWSNFKTAYQTFQAARGGADTEIMQQALASSIATNTILGLIAACSGLALFIMVLIPGNRGSNRYGNDPKDDNGGRPPAARTAFDEARIDDAIAELKAEKPYTPIFDFGPGSEDKPVIAAREAQPAPAPASTPAPSRYGVNDAKPTFGRRR